jgi:hypothetical protein
MLVWVRRHGNIWNTGRGPGYRVVVADGRDKPTMHVSQLIPVGAGPSQNEIDAFTGIDYNDWPSGKLPDGAEWGVFCEDQFRNRFRFLDKGEPPDICHPEDEQSVVAWLRVWRLANPTRPATAKPRAMLLDA